MKPYIQNTLVIVFMALVIAIQSCKPKTPIDFSTQIKPILNNKCITCHGGVKKSGGFSLLFEAEAFENTESGKPAIIRGNASASEFIKRLHEDDPELRMPYEKTKLSDKEIDLLTRWIDQGAKWGQHWAYSLPEKVSIPSVAIQTESSINKTPNFIKNDIDNFILARLEKEQLTPNTAAEKSNIARRVAYDITGLPPRAIFFKEYIAGKRSYETMVDSLFSQKSYGEKWASWWLDLARYADSKGYEKDKGREIWRYRDWVIKAFNKDVPYDIFTIEQLAGDLLPQPSADQLIATAFHRNTMNNDEGGSEDEEFRVASVMDRVNTTFEVWQSTTIGCVQCHSHPYDPFKHEDYYKAMAFFNNTRDEDTPDEAPTLKTYNASQKKKGISIINWLTKYGNKETKTAYDNFIKFSEPVYKAHSFQDFVNGAYDDHAAFVLWGNGSCRLEKVNTNSASSIYLKYNSSYKGSKLTIRENNNQGKIVGQYILNKTEGTTISKFSFEPLNHHSNLYFEVKNTSVPKEHTAIRVYWTAFLPDIPGKNQPGIGEINKAFLDLVNADTPTVPIMNENPAYMKRTTQVFDRGNWLLKTDTVKPGTPQTLNPWDTSWPENRLGLSKWIVDKKNPLTARTLVNRVWHQIFGRGLVSTIEDIGSQSEPPSHPQLLDWLALRFMNEHQWSIKSLIKEIVLSGTYRQSSKSSTKMYAKDPVNKFYARGPRIRLSAEEIRDQALAVSGLLSYKMYGPGVMPPQPDGVWQTVYNGSQWIESKGEDRYRRAVYTYLKRTSPYPSFLTFDAGSREVCSIRRTTTNTPLQALVTLNDPVYLEASYKLAKTTYIENDIDSSITNAYEKALFSKITQLKLKTLKELYATSLREFNNSVEATKMFLPLEENPSIQLSALTVVANAIMNLDEFLTKY